MKTDEFLKNHEIERDARTPRARRRTPEPEGYPVAFTGDQKPWANGPTYYFFDGERIRQHKTLAGLMLKISALSAARMSCGRFTRGDRQKNKKRENGY